MKNIQLCCLQVKRKRLKNLKCSSNLKCERTRKFLAVGNIDDVIRIYQKLDSDKRPTQILVMYLGPIEKSVPWNEIHIGKTKLLRFLAEIEQIAATNTLF